MEFLKIAAFLLFCLAVFVGNPQNRVSKAETMPNPVKEKGTESTEETAVFVQK
ncbi:hypothetical protein [Brevibacillus dissolubilis]|uniref:hypothetical protein n=1 Tax=Brevibacillus dissolubilis TaxID=1844116 RepID=UPI00159BE256|nr:hypothetical protein [Brevibacillus dissolubilis]